MTTKPTERREKRMSAVQQPELPRLPRFKVVGEAGSPHFPLRSARGELSGDDPVGEALCDHRCTIPVAPRELGRFLIRESRGDPIHRTRHERHVRIDPVDEPRHLPRERADGGAQHSPVVGQVVTGDESESSGTRTPARLQTEHEATDGGDRTDADEVVVEESCQQGSIESRPIIGIGGLGDRQADDGGRRSGDVIHE